MKKHFPNCPICGSKKGYVGSPFFSRVQCDECKGEWLVYDDGLELKEVSTSRWDGELLNHKFSFRFWKEIREPPQEMPNVSKIDVAGERTFFPIVYVDGHPDYKNGEMGYIVLRPENIAFKPLASSENKEMDIPVGKVRNIALRDGEYLEITYEHSLSALGVLLFKLEGAAKRKASDLETFLMPLVSEGTLSRMVRIHMMQAGGKRKK